MGQEWDGNGTGMGQEWDRNGTKTDFSSRPIILYFKSALDDLFVWSNVYCLVTDMANRKLEEYIP